MTECLVYSRLKSPGVTKRTIQSIVSRVLKKEGCEGYLSVHLIGDTRMIRLQREHRGKSTTTDVLSFPAREGRFGSAETSSPDLVRGSVSELGDIFISIPQIRRQARDWEVSFIEEFTRMLIHGILHILGYDHIQKSQAKKMFNLQEKYTSELL